MGNATGIRSLPRLPCACANLRRASRAVTQLYDKALRPSGLRTTQFTLLQVLAHVGEVRQGHLGRALALDSTTLSRTLAPLRRRGWVSIEPGDDRRERRIFLTPSGRKQLEGAEARWEKVQERLRQRLGAGRWDRLVALADAVVAATRRE